MMTLQFLGPVIASVLYVIVFQKAGFRGAMLAFCAAPVLGALLTSYVAYYLMPGGMTAVIAVLLVSMALSLLPLLMLAFMPWPPVAAPGSGGGVN